MFYFSKLNKKRGVCFLKKQIPLILFASHLYAQSAPLPPHWSYPTLEAPKKTNSKVKLSAYPQAKTLGHQKPLSFPIYSHGIAFELGQIFLIGELKKKYQDNLGGQLHYHYQVSDLFGFQMSLGYSAHPANLNTSHEKFSNTSLLTGMRLNLSWYDKINPHILGGLGFYRPCKSNPSINHSAYVFGLHLGPGIDLALSKYLFFGAALNFNFMFGKQKNEVHLGGSYANFFLRLGATL